MTRFTPTTWDGTLGAVGLLPRREYLSQRQGVKAKRPLYWDDLHDLERELVDLSATAKELGGWKRSLDVETAKHLVDACYGAYPVMVTWETRLGGRYDQPTIETKTTAVIVDQIFAPRGDQPGRMHIRYCGFGHPVHLHEVVEAHVHDTVVTFTDVEA